MSSFKPVGLSLRNLKPASTAIRKVIKKNIFFSFSFSFSSFFFFLFLCVCVCACVCVCVCACVCARVLGGGGLQVYV